jgi:hypothetical protein
MRQHEEASAAEEDEPGFWGTVAGGLMGEFNEDPSFSMIGIDLGVSLVPILDQASDARDLVAHLYYMTVRRQYDRFMRWVGLVFSLIGLIPEVGSAIKSASKFVIKGVREVITHLGDLLLPIRAVLPEVADLRRLQRYVADNWNRFVAFGTDFWNTSLARGAELIRHIPDLFRGLRTRVATALSRVREVTPTRLRNAFAWARQKWDEVLTQVREQLGRPRGEVTQDVSAEIDHAVERGIVEETAPQAGARSKRPTAAPSTRLAEAARCRFDQLRDGYASQLGVSSGGQVHHAIELQTLDRYPGVFTESTLNAFQNMRGIATELAGRRQLHNSKVRELWDRHYVNLYDDIVARRLRPGSDTYNDYVHRYLTDARDEIDYVLGQFFTEYRTGRPRAFP